MVWEGFLELPYKMVVSRSRVPYLVSSNHPSRVYVEVYEVSEDLLKQIDYYEDVPEFYESEWKWTRQRGKPGIHDW